MKTELRNIFAEGEWRPDSGHPHLRAAVLPEDQRENAACQPVLNSATFVLNLRAPKPLLGSFSAARWLAPYARIAGEYFYADKAGVDQLKALLKLEPAAKGENIIIDLASDAGVFQENVEAAPGLYCTGPIQTYLDLAAAGERGGEAAQHLFDERIAPMWKAGT